MKRFVSLLLAMVMALSMLPFAAFAAETEISSDFASFAELKALAARTDVTEVLECTYVGEETLVMDEDVTLPEWMTLSVSAPVVVAEGATVVMESVPMLADLTVDGDLTVKGLGMLVQGNLEVNGKLSISGPMYLLGGSVKGMENIEFAEGAAVCQISTAAGMLGLMAAMAKAELDTTEHLVHTVLLMDELEVNKDLTLPENFQLVTLGGVHIAKGAVLTTGWAPMFVSTVTVEGTICNAQGMYLLGLMGMQGELIIEEGGAYTGEGFIMGYNMDDPELNDPAAVISGLDLGKFKGGIDETLGYWILTPDALEAPVVTVDNVNSTGKTRLSWKKVEGAVKYQVYVSEDGENFKLLINSKTGKLTHGSAKVGKTYYYYVVAVGEDGSVSEKSNIVTGVRHLEQPVVTMEANEKTGKTVITWSKVKGAKGYAVYFAVGDSMEYTLLKEVKGTRLNHNSVKAGTKYRYKVMALCENEAGNSVFSSSKNRTADLVRPTAEVELNKKGKPSLDWNDIEGAKSYKVYIYNKNGKLLKTVTAKNSKLVHSSASKNTTYNYRVEAIHANSAANSAKSVKVTIKSK